ncbi:MAG: SH3 domain-containing protein [Candidatus Puniceispirillaceae bacterium]
MLQKTIKTCTTALIFYASILFATTVTADICEPEKGNPLKVVNVEADDTLNVRTGYTTKYPVLFELEPDHKNITYISSIFKTDECASLCEAYSQGGAALADLITERCLRKNLIWYRIKTNDGGEGWASSKYLKSYADPIVIALTDSSGVRHLSVDAAIKSNDHQVRIQALTDLNGITYPTVEDAITSNDYEVKLRALTSIEGIVYESIDQAIADERARAEILLSEALQKEKKTGESTSSIQQQNQVSRAPESSDSEFIVNTNFDRVVIGQVLKLHESEIHVVAGYELDEYWNFPFFVDDEGNKLDFEKTEYENEFALFQLECSKTPCVAKGTFQISFPWGEPRLTFKLTGYSKETATKIDTSIMNIVNQSRSVSVNMEGFASFGDQISQFVLRQNLNFLSSDRVTVDLSALNDAKMKEFVTNCYKKCVEVRVQGRLNIDVANGSARLVAEEIFKID